MGCLFKLTVYKRVGKIVILVHERVPKSAAKWKKWWCATFWKTFDYATESERLKTREKRGDYRNFYGFGLSLRYKKGVPFSFRYTKGVPFW